MHCGRNVCRGLAALVFTVASGSACALYTSLTVFGDSLLDSGNALVLNLGTPGIGVASGFLVPTNPAAPPYPPGATKYTNPGGQVAVEVLANQLGLLLTPSVGRRQQFRCRGRDHGHTQFRR